MPTISRADRAASLAFDFPGLRIGTAEYADGPTGCTVLRFDRKARMHVDPRGGAVCYAASSRSIEALGFAGGSVYGLDTLGGIRSALRDDGRNPTDWAQLPLVAGACVYDFVGRATTTTPDHLLGRQACLSAIEGHIPVGRHGAGAHATVGDAISVDRVEWGGQGAAFAQVGDVRVLVVTIVNALGAITDRAGRTVRGNRDPGTGDRADVLTEIRASLESGRTTQPPSGNTTVTALVTNVSLDDHELRDLARAAHTAMARVIRPFHTPFDGDVLFALSTAEISAGTLDPVSMSVLGGEVACDAVLSITDQAVPR
ncbi:P1 family peptidase [Acrocarpospora macrocephala]|uniref:Peptidase S58 n=1 Tax=Acrocarpospora macrocephala TaxID=150177 RepID=A0A5M3WI68_9ACTN|nr:P1 family peptidase [Acrocarpospora macrocephala]GES08825.1 peptidase S58 [Acrocarpospora macrocephala]